MYRSQGFALLHGTILRYGTSFISADGHGDFINNLKELDAQLQLISNEEMRILRNDIHFVLFLNVVSKCSSEQVKVDRNISKEFYRLLPKFGWELYFKLHLEFSWMKPLFQHCMLSLEVGAFTEVYGKLLTVVTEQNLEETITCASMVLEAGFCKLCDLDFISCSTILNSVNSLVGKWLGLRSKILETNADEFSCLYRDFAFATVNLIRILCIAVLSSEHRLQPESAILEIVDNLNLDNVESVCEQLEEFKFRQLVRTREFPKPVLKAFVRLCKLCRDIVLTGNFDRVVGEEGDRNVLRQAHKILTEVIEKTGVMTTEQELKDTLPPIMRILGEYCEFVEKAEKNDDCTVVNRRLPGFEVIWKNILNGDIFWERKTIECLEENVSLINPESAFHILLRIKESDQDLRAKDDLRKVVFTAAVGWPLVWQFTFHTRCIEYFSRTQYLDLMSGEGRLGANSLIAFCNKLGKNGRLNSQEKKQLFKYCLEDPIVATGSLVDMAVNSGQIALVAKAFRGLPSLTFVRDDSRLKESILCRVLEDRLLGNFSDQQIENAKTLLVKLIKVNPEKPLDFLPHVLTIEEFYSKIAYPRILTKAVDELTLRMLEFVEAVYSNEEVKCADDDVSLAIVLISVLQNCYSNWGTDTQTKAKIKKTAVALIKQLDSVNVKWIWVQVTSNANNVMGLSSFVPLAVSKSVSLVDVLWSWCYNPATDYSQISLSYFSNELDYSLFILTLSQVVPFCSTDDCKSVVGNLLQVPFETCSYACDLFSFTDIILASENPAVVRSVIICGILVDVVIMMMASQFDLTASFKAHILQLFAIATKEVMDKSADLSAIGLPVLCEICRLVHQVQASERAVNEINQLDILICSLVTSVTQSKYYPTVDVPSNLKVLVSFLTCCDNASQLVKMISYHIGI